MPVNAPEKPVGASLLAMTVAQSKLLQADPPLSRAGSLPQGICGVRDACERPGKTCGSEPARDDGGTVKTAAS